MKVGVSILSANMANLGDAVSRLDKTSADSIHLDIMDGVFVPNLSFGPKMVADLRPLTQKEFNVHLMMQTPLPYISAFAEAGADVITVHAESSDFEATLDEIAKCGKKAGAAINPETSEEEVYPVLHKISHLLVMSVHPGFGGQAFIPAVAEKIYDIRDFLGSLPIELAVDGGINLLSAKTARESGANMLCAGSFVTGSPDWEAAILALKNT